MISTQKSIYIIGGYRSNAYLGDFWRYCIETNTLKQVTLHASSGFTGNLQRSNHSAVLHTDNIYIFGGACSSKQKFNDVLKFNLKQGRIS